MNPHRPIRGCVLDRMPGFKGILGAVLCAMIVLFSTVVLGLRQDVGIEHDSDGLTGYHGENSPFWGFKVERFGFVKVVKAMRLPIQWHSFHSDPQRRGSAWYKARLDEETTAHRRQLRPEKLPHWSLLDSIDPIASSAVRELGYGWPFVMLSSRVVASTEALPDLIRNELGMRGPYDNRIQIMDTVDIAVVWAGKGQPADTFPTRLSWIGLIGNFVLWFVVMFVVFWTGNCAWSMNWLRRGRCPICGYDIQRSAAPGRCSQCGRADIQSISLIGCPECGWGRPAGEGEAPVSPP